MPIKSGTEIFVDNRHPAIVVTWNGDIGADGAETYGVRMEDGRIVEVGVSRLAIAAIKDN